MAATDELRRWFKDQTSRDPDLAETPSAVAAKLAPVMDQLSGEERRNNVAHLRAYSELYFQGRHNMPVPKEMTDQIGQLEQRAQRLEKVDQARAIVQSYGGPPSERTIADSLERSRLARQANVLSERQEAPQNSEAIKEATPVKEAVRQSVAATGLQGPGAVPTTEEQKERLTQREAPLREPVASQKQAIAKVNAASQSEKADGAAVEKVQERQKVSNQGERSREDLIRELREFSKQTTGLKYVPAEAALATNLANQLESGAKTIDLSQRYATADSQAAGRRHEKALKNLEPALKEASKHAEKINRGESIAHGVKNQEVLAVNTGIENGLQQANGILQKASAHNHHAVEAPKLSLGGGL